MKNINVSEIIRLHDVEKLSSYEIGERLNMAPSTVRYHLRKHKKLRDKSEAQKNYLSRNQHQRCGKKHSEESKSKIRKSSQRSD